MKRAGKLALFAKALQIRGCQNIFRDALERANMHTGKLPGRKIHLGSNPRSSTNFLFTEDKPNWFRQ